MENDQLSPPDITSLLMKHKTNIKTTLNAVNIGIIQSFDAAKQTATIKVAIKVVRDVKPDGTKTLTEHPLLLKVPVMMLFGGNSFLSMPIVAGDTCILLFNDRDIDNWLVNGGSQIPNSRRTHDISDAIAIVGLRDFQHSITDYLTGGIRLQFAGNSKIDLTNNAINSLAALFTHTGNVKVVGDVRIEGGLTVTGTVTGISGGGFDVNTDITQATGKVLKAGNGATGTFNIVTVADGIVTGGS